MLCIYFLDTVGTLSVCVCVCVYIVGCVYKRYIYLQKHKLLYLPFTEKDNTSFVRNSVRMNWSLWMLVIIDLVPCPWAQLQSLYQQFWLSVLALGLHLWNLPVLLLFVVDFALWILFCSPALTWTWLLYLLWLPDTSSPECWSQCYEAMGVSVRQLFSEILLFPRTYSVL